MGSDGPGRRVTAGGWRTLPRQLDLTRPEAYGRAFDDVYDQWYGLDGDDLGAMAKFVRARCPSGLVIELGVGSGRLAVPLLNTGLQVIGLDASRPMLRRCPPEIPRVGADMADLPFRPARSRGQRRNTASDTPSDGPTVLCGFNTLFNLGSAEDLDRLLASITDMQATFIVEMMNIDLLPDGPIHSTDVAPFAIDDGIVISATSANAAQRQLTGRHLEITDRGVVSRPWLLRLVGSAELDSRAAKYGLRAAERYRSWEAEPFAESDQRSISVYRPSTGPAVTRPGGTSPS